MILSSIVISGNQEIGQFLKFSFSLFERVNRNLTFSHQQLMLPINKSDVEASLININNFFSMRRPQFDQQSSITSELSALYLYENQRLPVYDEFQSDDYANLEPLKALTPEDLKMLSLPDSEDSATDSTHEIDQYWSHGGSDTASTSQMTSSFVPFATSTQVATSSFDDVTEVTGSQMTTLSCANPMPELSIDDLNPSESFVFSSVNEEEEEEEDDEEEDNELHVKFL